MYREFQIKYFLFLRTPFVLPMYHFRQIQSETWAILRRQRTWYISITCMKAIGSILIKSVLPSNHRICHQHPPFMEGGPPFSLTLFIENLKIRFYLFLLTTNQSGLREEGEWGKKIDCKLRMWNNIWSPVL